MSNATAIADKMPRRRPSVDAVISESGLPTSIGALITNITRQTRLWKRERADVALELVAHFRDGIDAGRSADELIRDFGDTKNAAKLIRRAKRRNRAWWWQAQRRMTQGLLAVFTVVFIYSLISMVRFYTGTPKIKHNYFADLNAPVLAIPEQDRAWPMYLTAIESLMDAPTNGNLNYTPGGDGWPIERAYVESKQDALAQLRAAAAKPALGFILGPLSEREKKLQPSTVDTPDYTKYLGDSSDYPSLIGVGLPHLGKLRISARLLTSDAFIAAESHDTKRVHHDLSAVIAIARHTREQPFLICDLVSLAIVELAQNTIARLLTDNPSALDIQSLVSLAHEFAAYPGDQPMIRFGSERLFWDDTAQRLYTDNGHGNGHLTARGMLALRSMTQSYDSQGHMIERANYLDPLAGVISADRRTVTKKFDEMYDVVERAIATPLWLRDDTDNANRLDVETYRMSIDPIMELRYPAIAALMPALGSATHTSERFIQKQNTTLILIALELYKRREGDYPASLAQLVPSLLPAVPLDRYDGKPLRYKRTPDGRFMIYSVGSDLDDDGGIPGRAHVGQIADKDRLANTTRWYGKQRVEHAERTGEWGDIPDGDWILYPAQP